MRPENKDAEVQADIDTLVSVNGHWNGWVVRDLEGKRQED